MAFCYQFFGILAVDGFAFALAVWGILATNNRAFVGRNAAPF
jgi:hypothetical protein